MREFELLIDEALSKGLCPSGSAVANLQFLYECKGFRCGKLGLERHVTLDNPLPSTLDLQYQWPFPQFLDGDTFRILIVRDLINLEDIVYSVSADFSTVTQIFAIDELTFGKGGLMELADFGEYVFMTNGLVMLYYDPVTSIWNVVTSLSKVPMMKTVCNFKGRAVGGNIVSDWYDCDSTFYVWSRIGEMDFIPDRRNTEGYRKDPYGGEVYSVRRLGDIVIGYSSKGITSLYPVMEPATTFGFKEMLDIGMINQGANDGDYRRHVFVGSDYKLYEISDQGIGELDYQSEISTLAGEDIMVKYDKVTKDFYIGNSQKTYLLSSTGLTEVFQHPSAVWDDGETSYMLPDDVDDEPYAITSWPFDFQYKGNKTVFNIESDAFGTTSPQAGVDLTYDHKTWKSPDLTPINSVGFSSMVFAGNMFRFKLTFDAVDGTFKISYIKVRYKMTDLRGMRGVYAPGLRGQSS